MARGRPGPGEPEARGQTRTGSAPRSRLLLGVPDCLLGVLGYGLGVPDSYLGVFGYGLGVPDSYWVFSAMDWAFSMLDACLMVRGSWLNSWPGAGPALAMSHEPPLASLGHEP